MRILVAEDEALIRMAIVKYLAAYSPVFSEILEAENGDDAMLIIQEQTPDIVLLDIRMPGINGLEIVERSLKEHQNFKKIIISGYSEFEYAQKAMYMGTSAYLLKPVQKKELYKTLDKVRSEIRREKQMQEHMHQYQDDLERFKVIAKRNTLYDVLENREPEKHELQMVSFSEWYGVILVEIKSGSNERTGKPFTSFLETLITEWKDSIVFQQSKRRFVIVVGLQQPEETELHRLAGKVLQSLKLQFPICRCAVSVSGIGAKYSSIRTMYLQAVEYLLEKINLSDHDVLTKKVEAPPVDINRYAHTICALVELVEMGDSKKINCAILSLIDLVNKDKYLNYNNLKMITNYLLARLHSVLSKFLLNIIDPFLIEDCYDLEDYVSRLTAYLSSCSAMLRSAKFSEKEQGFECAIRYINEHYADNITLDYVAELAGLSPNYFSELFRKRMQCNYIEYLTSLRIEKAKKLLINQPKLTIAQVGYRVGYENTRYFSKLFIKRTGQKPKEFRNSPLIE